MLMNILLLASLQCRFEGTTLFRHAESNISNFNSKDPRLYFDWRERGVVSHVKDQGHCAACWAFSIVASIESHLAIYLNQCEILSEQFLIDCDTEIDGCVSAPLLKSFSNIVTKFGGVLRATNYYPYADKKLECRWSHPDKKSNELRSMNPNTTAALRKENDEEAEYIFHEEYSSAMPVPVIGFRRVKADEEVMAQFLRDYGPLAAAINSASMVTYTGDIDEPTDETCNPNNLTHTVLIVGYSYYEYPDTGRRLPYWIIKNSWGKNWGAEGYYYLVRGRNACGITADVAFPFVD